MEESLTISTRIMKNGGVPAPPSQAIQTQPHGFAQKSKVREPQETVPDRNSWLTPKALKNLAQGNTLGK